jgi:hypothetical protein
MRISRPLSAIVLMAVLVRVAFAFLFLRQAVSDIVPQDMEAYVGLARAIAAGSFRDPLFDFINPPYAFVLCPFLSLSPSAATLGVLALQIVIDAGSVALVFFIAARTFTPPVGLLAAALYALYGTAIYYTAIVLPVTLTIFTLLLAVAALAAGRTGPPRRALLAGIALGLFILFRPNALLFLPAAVAWLVLSARTAGERPGTSLRRCAAMVVGTGIAVAPFAVRSIVTSGSPSPFPVNGGVNFYIGNNADATGLYNHLPNIADRPVEQVLSSIEEASRRAGRRLDAREASAFWFAEGARFLRQHPSEAFALLLRKTWYFFRHEEMSLNISYNLAREQVPLLQGTLGFGALAALAAWGMLGALRLRARRRDPNVWLVLGAVVLYGVSVVLFFVSDRYRIPVAPLLAILAAQGAMSMFDDARARRFRGVATGALVTALAAVLVGYKFQTFRFLDPMPRFQLAGAYYGRGDFDRGLAECEKGLAMVPASAQGLYCRASGHYYKKEYYEAEMGLRETLANLGVFTDLGARSNLAVVYEDVGLYQAALRVSDDEDERARLRAAREDFERRRPDPAAYATEQQALGTSALAAGRFAEARYAFLRALEADPHLTAAPPALARACLALHLLEKECAPATP